MQLFLYIYRVTSPSVHYLNESTLPPGLIIHAKLALY